LRVPAQPSGVAQLGTSSASAAVRLGATHGAADAVGGSGAARRGSGMAIDSDELVGMASGSLIGMLIGVLGGPLGVLLGWGAGAIMGGAFDVDRAVTSDEAFTVLGRAIPPGKTAVIASVEEPAVEVIDAEMYKLGGEVTCRPVAEVMGELKAAEEAADAAAREARRELREKRKAEVQADVNERVGKLKEKLHVS
jgi:uncharacterized membrane protein